MTKYSVHEFAIVNGLDLMVYIGDIENTSFGLTIQERYEFMRLRIREVYNQLALCITNLNPETLQIVYVKDMGNLAEWYRIEDTFLVYEFVDMEDLLTGGMTLT